MTDITVPENEVPLYSAEETTRIILCWCILWVAAHYLAWPIWKRRRVLGLICSPTPVERYRRRLCRSQVYCCLAVAGGLRLLLGCRWSAYDLLYSFSAEHQVLFSMAIAHWLVSVWEDLQNWTFLRGGLSAKDTQSGGDPSYFLWQAYLVHHLVAALAFLCALRMQVCTGLASFGLTFEMPVLYMNLREFIVYADNPVQWFHDIRNVERFWNTLMIWWRLARGVPTLVYIYSLIFWSLDLAKLSNKEAWTYHGMAIFFSVLNWGLASTFLSAWQKKDMEVAESAAKAQDFEEKLRELMKPENEVQLAEKEKKAEESSIAPDIPEVVKKPLTQVSPELFASKVQGEEGELWLEIDNIAYNLTEFLGKHPGGDAILRKFAGKDASKAFHKAKHSMKAKMLMQMYCVGPMMKELKVYRMFEHTMEVRTLLFTFLQLAGLLAVASWMLPNSYYPIVRSLHEETALNRLLAPGLAFTLGTCTLLLPGPSRFNPTNWTCGALYFSACFTSLLVGLELGRRPVENLWPSGLEIGAVLIFVVEEIYIHLGPEGWQFLYWRRNTLAAALLILSWNFRGATLDMVDNSPAHVLGGVLIGISVPSLCRLASPQQEVVMDQALQGLALTNFLGIPMLLYLVMPQTDIIRTMVRHVWASWTINTLVTAFASSIASLVFVAMLLSYACKSSSQMASRMVGFIISLAVLLRSGFSAWHWLAWLAWYTMVGTLGHRNVALLDDLQKKGKLGDVSVDKIAVRGGWELFYLVLGALLWQVVQGPIKALINGLMPQELQFYAPWLPFFELGEDVDIGVAAYYAPKEALKSKEGPHHFVCSVRHMDAAHPEGQRDLQLQRNTAREMWMKCKDTSSGGLVANVNCFFPRLSGSTHCKEINLSGWVSSEAAEKWSAKHSGLPGVQSQSSRGQMRTLGTMQAILKPHGEIRHQDRCSNCARLSESDTLGEKAPERCKYCGKRNYGYPFF